MIRIAVCDDDKKYLDESEMFLSEYATARNTRFSVERFENPFDFLDKLDKGEEVALSVLLRICEYLDCDIGDICSVVKRAKEDTV